MSRWSPDRSSLLSLLLDEVTGTQEAIAIRQDYAVIHECLIQVPSQKFYYTGSRAEGLDLPGSDDDFMLDINNKYNVKVFQSTNETSSTSSEVILYLRTENVKPGFALLEIPRVPLCLGMCIERINGMTCLSSNLIVKYIFNTTQSFKFGNLFKRQGPSVENQLYSSFVVPSRKQLPLEGMDQVVSIHCDFWPNEASEWCLRQRNFGWPTPSTLSSIVSFGFHLVAVGHPHSETKLTEWRISFSMAERLLVWSFNHVQIQCYAVMKIILKQFIKKKCSPTNQVLCSYFIKTFLFWKFETTDTHFWQEDNFRECIKCLITEFAQCVHEGKLRHYFIPKFNLLSVKLTREAQSELLQLYDIVIQYDMSILRECKSLQPIWSKLLSADKNQMSIIHNALKSNFIQNDELFLTNCFKLVLLFFANLTENTMKHYIGEESFNLLSGIFTWFMKGIQTTREHIISSILSLPCKSHLKSLLVKRILWDKYLHSLIRPCRDKNTNQITHSESSAFDLSTDKIWYAINLMSTRDFSSALIILNNVLSTIPPFYLCISTHETHDRRLAKQFYADNYMNSGLTVMERARKAWMMPLTFEKYMTDVVPLAIQIELYFSDSVLFDWSSVMFSPFVMLHYLAFQCYHELGQYDLRANALYQLLDDLKTDDLRYKLSFYHSLNIAGHCCLIAGDIDKARHMFTSSSKRIEESQIKVPSSKGTAATWYLKHFC